MHHSIRKLCITSLLAAAGLAQAQSNAYEGWYWNSAQAYWQGRDIWGNGPYGETYRGFRGDGGLVAWEGAGSHSAPAGLGHFVDTPTAVSFQSSPAGGFWGDTYSGGRLELPAAANFPAVVHASFHVYSVLGDNPGGEATFSNGEIAGSFYTNNPATPRQPLYWRIDYRLDVNGTADFIGSGSISHLGAFGFDISPGSGSFSGVMDVVPQGFDTRLIVPVRVASGAMDRGGLPATGRTDLWVEMYFSREPITAVPEPGTWALWLAGLAVAGGALRRGERDARQQTQAA